jgi:hypothetical protein
VAARIGSAASGVTLSKLVASTSARFHQLLSRRPLQPLQQQPALEDAISSLGMKSEITLQCESFFLRRFFFLGSFSSFGMRGRESAKFFLSVLIHQMCMCETKKTKKRTVYVKEEESTGAYPSNFYV